MRRPLACDVQLNTAAAALLAQAELLLGNVPVVTIETVYCTGHD
jgi:hypothetical protein